MKKVKTVLTVAAVGLVVALTLGSSAYLFWKIRTLEEENQRLLNQVTVNHENLTKSLQRAETSQVTQADLAAFAEEVGLDIQKLRGDLRSLGADLEAIASTKAKTTTIHHHHAPSDSSSSSEIEVPTCKEDGRPIDIHRYTERIESRELRDSSGMRIADVSFEAAEENPWSSTTWGISYTINNSVARTRDGSIVLHTELLAESEAQPGEIFRIEGAESRVLQVPEEVHFEWWNPQLYLTAQLGINAWPGIDLSASLAIGFSVMSYGNWAFFGISAGFDGWNRSFFASFIPLMYNIGEPIPLLSDLEVGPHVGIDHNANVSVGITIGTRL